MLLHVTSRLRPFPPFLRSISTATTTTILTNKECLIQEEISQKCSPILSVLQRKYTGNATLSEITELVKGPRRVHGAVVQLFGELIQKLPQVVISPELAEHQKAIAITVEMAKLGAQIHEKVGSHEEEEKATSVQSTEAIISNKLAILIGDYIASQMLVVSYRFEGSTEILSLQSELLKHLCEAVFEAEAEDDDVKSWLRGQLRRHVIPLALGCQSVARITLPPSEHRLVSSAYEFGINFGHFWRIREVLEQETLRVDRNQLKAYSAEFQNKAFTCLEQFSSLESDAKKCLYGLLKPSRHLR